MRGREFIARGKKEFPDITARVRRLGILGMDKRTIDPAGHHMLVLTCLIYIKFRRVKCSYYTTRPINVTTILNIWISVIATSTVVKHG